MRLCDSGIRFCSPHVLGRDWKPLDRRRAASAHRLPALLSLAEGPRLLPVAPPLPKRVSCTTVSSGGRRLPAALARPVRASESPRPRVHVPRGQGAQERSGPLPHDTLARLRLSWQPQRHPPWLLPATGRAHTPMAPATAPLRRRRVQGACRQAPPRAGLLNRDVGVPTLRHASATQLRAAGVNLRARPRSRGHAHLATPLLSLHLTPQGPEAASQRLDARRRGCPA
jgi:hypothetical protein